jgi:mannose-1-phosphate guanylyltransferase
MMMQALGRVIPVFLPGGTGSRLWPLPRETYPKQLLSLLDEQTLLQPSGTYLGEDDIVRVQDIYHRA